ncbi:transaldolase family protein, partial [Streptomyces sp. URMC 124]|uniref:transaldolase family protein n=1 Tax=Streptomyces sp. URMC 124 TaxID=3423405 RepID=UPI003F1C8EC1
MGERTVTSGGEVLRELLAEGVSPWLDGLRRSLLASGTLARLVAAGEVRGATSDPGALASEVAGGSAYGQQLSHLACRSVPPAVAVQALCAYDLRSACDELRPVFAATQGLDGYVSMGLDPRPGGAARGTACAVVDAAVALHRAACRPNALVKIAATDDGLAAAGACLARGIGVHVTDVFSVRRYEQVVDVWFAGLERARGAGLDLSAIPSVVSLPVGRIDAAVDAVAGPRRRAGRASLAVARLVYRRYEEALGSARWRVLATAGARPQRVMWSVGSPVETVPRGVPYVESLVAWGTVSAMSEATLAAAGRRGRLRG